MYFAISYFLPLEKDKALHLNKVQSPLLKDALCQVWLKSAQWLWRRRFFNFVNVFSVFRNYLPLEKGGVVHMNKLESPSPKETLCQVWLIEIGQEGENVTEKFTDRRRTTGDQKSSLELSAQVS